MKKKIFINGMSCMHCVGHVREALEEVGGVEVIEINLEGKYALVQTEVDNDTLKEAIEAEDYEVVEIEQQ